MKTEILTKLFESKWNYAWGSSDLPAHIISLFYRHGGFEALHKYIAAEKVRMSSNKNFSFKSYYSKDLVETLEEAKRTLTDNDFREYIFNTFTVRFNKNNFLKLEEYGLLKHFGDFSGTFRGNIVELHKIGDYSIIETLQKKDGKIFYNVAQFSTSFTSLEHALLYNIYKGNYFNALIDLLEASNKLKP